MSATPAPASSLVSAAEAAVAGTASRAAVSRARAARCMPSKRSARGLLALEEVDLGDLRALGILRQLRDPHEVVAPLVAGGVEIDRRAAASGVDVPDVAPEARHGRRHVVARDVDLALPPGRRGADVHAGGRDTGLGVDVDADAGLVEAVAVGLGRPGGIGIAVEHG